MSDTFKEFLQSSELCILDGAYPTALYDKGFYINRSFEELSVTDSHVVKEVTLGFASAGSQLLHTNTFSAIRPKLEKYGLQNCIEEIISASVKITRETITENQYVLGTIGPMGVLLEPLGPTSFLEAKSYFREMARLLIKYGVDGLSLVGFHDLSELVVAIEAASEIADVPILAHLGIQENMKTSYGHTIAEYVERVEPLGVSVIGFAGEVGPSGMLTALQEIKPLTTLPISLLPNAGLPRYVNDQYIYLCNPDYIGKYAKRFVQNGARLIGGFSGVGEEHIKAISNAVKMVQSSNKEFTNPGYKVPSSIRDVVDQPQVKTEAQVRSQLGNDLFNNKKVISVEIIPPKGVDCTQFFELCSELQHGGVKFVNIPDGARAVARMSSLQLATYVQNKFNLEPIPHFTTRDRNLIGLQSDLLGAYVNGVKNVLLVTGDPPKLGNCPGATAVYDVDAIGLTHIVSRMNQGLDIGGTSFGQKTGFLAGVALNPTAPNRRLEIQRFKYKVEAGADFAITQPIYSLETYIEFFEELGEVDIPIIMGIWPLVSLRNAEFLKNEVPGVDVPDWVIDEMQKAKGDKEDALKRGIEIAYKTMDAGKKLVNGFQVSAPFNKVNVALEVLKALGEE